MASETYLSPLTYINNDAFGFSIGIGAKNYNPAKIEIGSVWVLTAADNTLTL